MEHVARHPEVDEIPIAEHGVIGNMHSMLYTSKSADFMLLLLRSNSVESVKRGSSFSRFTCLYRSRSDGWC